MIWHYHDIIVTTQNKLNQTIIIQLIWFIPFKLICSNSHDTSVSTLNKINWINLHSVDSIQPIQTLLINIITTHISQYQTDSINRHSMDLIHPIRTCLITIITTHLYQIKTNKIKHLSFNWFKSFHSNSADSFHHSTFVSKPIKSI